MSDPIQIPPLHLCLSLRLHNDHLPADGTCHSWSACQPQAPVREKAATGTFLPRKSLQRPCRWLAVQAATICFGKLNIFRKELKDFPLALTRWVLLKATGTESLHLFRILSVNNQALQMEMHTSPYHSVTFYYLSKKTII